MHAEIIDSIRFGIISPYEIKKMSVAKLNVPDTYNEDGYPIDGGLLDQRLGVIDPGLICKTCGGRAKSCPGHFGHIELVRPVIHSEFSKLIYMLLQSTCSSCNRILIGDEKIDEIKKSILAEAEEAEAQPASHTQQQQRRGRAAKSVRKCPHCGEQQPKVRFSVPTYFDLGDKRLRPDEIRDMLSKISDDDLRLLNIDPKISRPEWLMVSSLLVPPVNVRPSITLESGERSEDDLTHKLVDIMRINQRLEQNINAGAPQIIIDDLWELLQYHVTAYFNNETSGIPPARHRSGRALKTLAQRLKGKEGRFRYNLSGKRVNYSARTVISVDPYLDIDEVGVPLEIASKLTVPFYVTAWNLEEAKRMLARTEYPMVLNIIAKDGKRKRVIEGNIEELQKVLGVGEILERQLMDGDIALFNRQPSLHRISIMAHRVKVLPGKTFRINYCTTTPYNADFDGDEMNLHVPQTLEAQAEARYLMEVQYQVFSPRDGAAVITNSEDGISGMYELTKDSTKLTKDEAAYLLGIVGIYDFPISGNLISGKEIFSALLPKGLNYEQKTSHGNFRIKNGKLIDGVVTKETYGRDNALAVKIAVDFGFEELRKFIFVSSKLADAYVTLSGVTVGTKEYAINKKIEEAKEKIISETSAKVSKLIDEYRHRTLEPLMGHTLRESLERMIIAELNTARAFAGEVISANEDETNSAVEMARSGSRGSILNLEQMSMFLGQQATLSGGRIKRGYYTGRLLPHIKPNDIGPSARGFITTNYYSGLAPADLFMHAVGSRGSEVYKALLTGRSGYLYRRLSNALQDYYVEQDMSIRNVNNNIIQTVYGGDMISPTSVQFVKIDEEHEKKYHVHYGEPVGMLAAQSIGEPGTQMILRTFHYAGIEATIATSGLPRIVELVDAKKKPTTPITYVYLEKGIEKNFEKAEAVARKISEIRVGSLVRRTIENFAKGTIKLVLDKQAIEAEDLTPGEITARLKKLADVEASVEGGNIIVKLHTRNLKEVRITGVKLLKKALQGIDGAGKAIVQQAKDGSFYILVAGSNIEAIIDVEGIDKRRIYTNDAFAMQRFFGIEAARNTIANELKKTLEEQKIDVDERHLLLVADAMTYDGSIKGVGRHGLSGQKDSVFARAAYEETVKHLVNAAVFGEIDPMKGVTENILVGKQIPIGTGAVKLAIKKADIKKIKKEE